MSNNSSNEWWYIHMMKPYAVTKNILTSALARWLSWLEHGPIYQEAAGSMPGQVTYIGCGFNPWLGCGQEATNKCFSLTLMYVFLFLPLPLSSLSKISEHILG